MTQPAHPQQPTDPWWATPPPSSAMPSPAAPTQTLPPAPSAFGAGVPPVAPARPGPSFGTSWGPSVAPPAAPGSRPAGPSSGRRIVEISLAALLAAGLASAGTYAVVHQSTASSSTSSVASAPREAPVIQGNATAPDWAATAKAVAPSVVAITVTSGQTEGQGSGVVIDTAGHILTNNHVATGAGSGATITVTLADGRTYDASIVGTDPSTDLAVLALKGAPTDLTPISFGDSDKLAVGDPVMAVGNPLGLAGTVTTGIVSALDRPVSTGGQSQSRTSSSDVVVTNAIQTSAAINPGNSGGALVTAAGQLVGINSSIASLGTGTESQSGNIGIGFAIPVNEARSIAEQLISTGTAAHAYLGISSADTTVADGGAQRAAAVVKSVASGTPAEAAGLQVGDVITAIDGKRIDSSLALVAAIREQKVGDSVTLSIVRGTSASDLKVTLTARPASAGG